MKNKKFVFIFLSFFSIIALCFSFITPHINKYAGAFLKPTYNNSYTYGDTWENMTWYGLTTFNGRDIWTDGVDIYFSNNTVSYVLDKDTSTWSVTTFYGATFYGRGVFTDGVNVYYAYNSPVYKLDISTKTWSALSFTNNSDGEVNTSNLNGANFIYYDGVWYYFSSAFYAFDFVNLTYYNSPFGSGITNFSGSYIWSDGFNYYFSNNANQYIINFDTFIISPFTWGGVTNIRANYLFNAGSNVFYGYSGSYYILDISNHYWNSFTWSNPPSNFSNLYIWSDGVNIYYSNNGVNLVLYGTYIPPDEPAGPNYPYVMPSIVDAFVGGIVGFAGMIGGAFNNLADTLFFETINDNVGLSAFGTLAFSFLGLTIALSFAKYIINFIVNKGDYYCEK